MLRLVNLKKIPLAILLLVLACASAFAQASGSLLTVAGAVYDASDEPIIGASVKVKGSSNMGTVTDADGNFTLANIPANSVLVFSYVGMTQREIKASDAQALKKVVMEDDNKLLEEVVVVGYGTQKKVNLTGAVSQISMDKVLGDRPVSSVGNALQGAIPGLVVSPSATPGANASFNIRGTTSINGGSPLVLIDNVPGDINLLNPEDIESVSVLKDAASAAVYGARSAFGVILITTKKAAKGEKFSATYSNSFGWNHAINRAEMISTLEYIDIYQDTWGDTHFVQSMDMDTWRDLMIKHQNGQLDGVEDSGRYIDPDGKVYFLNDKNVMASALGTGFQQTHNLAVKGGTDKLTYRLSLGYVNNNGVLKGSKDVYERFNVSSYINADITDWLSTSLDMRFTKGDQATPDNSSGVIWTARSPRYFPTGTLIDANGELQYWETPENAVLLAPTNHTVKKNPRIFSHTSIRPFKGMDIIFEYTYNGTEQDIRTYNGYYSMMHAQNTQVTAPKTSSYSNNKVSTDYNSINAYATYIKNFGPHHLKVMGGFSQETSSTKYLNVNRLDMINTDMPSISGGIGETTATDQYVEYIIRGGYGRINYDYKDKYLLELNGRYDGSSRFPRSNRFGFFPSGSIGWRISQEDFMGWSRTWLNEFKVRASYGEIGNQAISDYGYFANMNPGKAGWILDGTRPMTLSTPGMISSNFTWEKARTLNIGVDASLFNNRLQATVEWYQRDTRGMLTAGRELSAEAGTTAPQQNAANLRNRGWELTLNWRDRIGEVDYRIGFNLYDSKAKITKYDNENRSLSMAHYEGQTIGEIWGYVTDGFYTIHDFVRSGDGVKGWEDGVWTLKEGVTSIQGTSPRPGDHKFVNLNDDENSLNRIDSGANTVDNPGDRKIIGNNTARYQFGGSLGVSYKGFDLSMIFQGTGKRDVWNDGHMRWGWGSNSTSSNIFEGQDDYWRPSDPDANTIEGWTPVDPDPAYHRYYGNLQNASSNRRVQTRYLLNGAYLRIKNITLAYVLPKQVVSRVGLANARVYVSGENLFTFDHLPSGFDPERLSWSYPYYRTLSFGVSLSL